MDDSSTDGETIQTVDGAVASADAEEGPRQVPLEAPIDTVLIDAAPVPARPGNRLALLGLILAVPVWPAGLVLSALGLYRAVTRGAGKVMAVIGVILSIVTGGAIVAVVANATSTVAASTALDPGCTGIETQLRTDLATLKSDAATVQADQDDAVTSAGSINAVAADLTKIQSDLSGAGKNATHAAVSSELDTMNTQVQAVGTELSGIESHSTSSEGAAAAALTKLADADATLDALCATY